MGPIGHYGAYGHSIFPLTLPENEEVVLLPIQTMLPFTEPPPLALPPAPSNSIFPSSVPLSATSPLPSLMMLPSTVPSTVQSPEETNRVPNLDRHAYAPARKIAPPRSPL